MVTDIGLILLLLAGLCALLAVCAAIYSSMSGRPAWALAGRNALVAIVPLLTLSVLAVVYANLVGDYRLEYATQVSSRATPWYLRITALWAGQNGSLLFWIWLMALFCAGALRREWDRWPDAMPVVLGVMAAVELFFIGLVIFYANPFARWWRLPGGEIISAVLPPPNGQSFMAADGRGLAPLLRHAGMVIHPPLLYLGFVGWLVPFAFAVAALMSGGPANIWLDLTRRWTLIAWLFLSAGLLVGARWAYDVLGWGGYWGWDAVENAALMPWLSATAFIHSATIQERRGMFRVWNMVLIILTFCQVILGTFITRTGVISSVHSFARSSIGAPFLVFTGVTLIGSTFLLLRRLDDLKSKDRLDNFLSREAAFLLQNVLFMLVNFVVALGTYFPILSELFSGDKITVGPPYYNQTVGPLLVPLLVLMGIAPLLGWRSTARLLLLRALGASALIATLAVVALVAARVSVVIALLGLWIVAFSGALVLLEAGRGILARRKTTGESYLLACWNLLRQNRRRYGGYLIHLAVVVMALGVIGAQHLQLETQRSLEVGQTLSIGDYTLQFVGLEMLPSAEADKEIVAARLSVTPNAGAPILLKPVQEIYANGERLTPPTLWMSLKEDLYILLVGWEDSGASATFKVFVNPLINWLWLGGLLFIVGTLVAASSKVKGANA